jgi:CheY-like chemotaxis protein
MLSRKGSSQHDPSIDKPNIFTSVQRIVNVIKWLRMHKALLVVHHLEGQKEMKRARILLADDDLHVLATVNKLLQTDFEIVDMVSDGPSLVAAAFKFQPDVIVTDISMPKLNGIEAIRQIRGFLPGIKCIFLTMHGASGYRREAQSVGATGYVLKSSAREELNQAIRQAMEDPA